MAQRVDLFPPVDELDSSLYMWILDPSSNPQSKKVTIQKFDDRYRNEVSAIPFSDISGTDTVLVHSDTLGLLLAFIQNHIASFGSSDEIPHVSLGADDFNYSSTFRYNGSDLTVDSSFVNNDDTGTTIFSGGNTSSSGANLTLYGGSHATDSNAIRFRADTTEILRYNPSSGGIWDFLKTSVVVGGSIFSDNSASSLFISGGDLSNVGASITLFGEDDPTSGNDLWFAGGSVVQLIYDFSDSEWNFQDNDIITNGELQFDSPNSTWTPVISFGGGSTGITYSSQSGIHFRNGDLVFFTLQITLTSKGTSTGSVLISGLPYAALSDSYGRIGFYINFKDCHWFIINNSSTINLAELNSSTFLDNVDFNNNTIIRLSGFYYTDDPY